MTITVRLPEDLEIELRRRFAEDRRAVSNFVREAIVEKMQRDAEATPQRSARELGKHLFGKYGNGDPDGSAARKERLHAAVDAKHRRRQRPVD